MRARFSCHCRGRSKNGLKKYSFARILEQNISSFPKEYRYLLCNSSFDPQEKKNRLNHFLKICMRKNNKRLSAQGKDLWSNFFHLKFELLLVLFCRCCSLSLCFRFCSSHRSSKEHATLSELLKICQKLHLNKLKIKTPSFKYISLQCLT